MRKIHHVDEVLNVFVYTQIKSEDSDVYSHGYLCVGGVSFLLSLKTHQNSNHHCTLLIESE